MMPTNTQLAHKPNYAWTGTSMIDVLNPNPNDIHLTDIAVGLSRESRYGGSATSRFWSVGQHSLFCDFLAERHDERRPEVRLAIMLHDAPEYMLRDMIAPVKRHMPEYQGLESIWWTAVARSFYLPDVMPPCVKKYDVIAGAVERRDLISEDAGEWPGMGAEIAEGFSIPRHLSELTMDKCAGMFDSAVMHWLSKVTSHPA